MEVKYSVNLYSKVKFGVFCSELLHSSYQLSFGCYQMLIWRCSCDSTRSVLL